MWNGGYQRKSGIRTVPKYANKLRLLQQEKKKKEINNVVAVLFFLVSSRFISWQNETARSHTCVCVCVRVCIFSFTVPYLGQFASASVTF